MGTLIYCVSISFFLINVARSNGLHLSRIRRHDSDNDLKEWSELDSLDMDSSYLKEEDSESSDTELLYLKEIGGSDNHFYDDLGSYEAPKITEIKTNQSVGKSEADRLENSALNLFTELPKVYQAGFTKYYNNFTLTKGSSLLTKESDLSIWSNMFATKFEELDDLEENENFLAVFNLPVTISLTEISRTGMKKEQKKDVISTRTSDKLTTEIPPSTMPICSTIKHTPTLTKALLNQLNQSRTKRFERWKKEEDENKEECVLSAPTFRYKILYAHYIFFEMFRSFKESLMRCDC